MIDSFIYVISAPYFWQTMGITSATTMYLGSLLYNGDFKLLAKGIITVLPYVAMLLLVNLLRITSHGIENQVLAYAGSITIFVLSVFYFFGLFTGVWITKIAHRKKGSYATTN